MWAAVAVSIIQVGHGLLAPTRPLVVTGFFVAVIPLMAAVTYPVYRYYEIASGARPAAAALMALPGMCLDVLLVVFAGEVFPAMTTATVINFAAILLFSYAIVLGTGFVPIDTG